MHRRSDEPGSACCPYPLPSRESLANNRPLGDSRPPVRSPTKLLLWTRSVGNRSDRCSSATKLLRRRSAAAGGAAAQFSRAGWALMNQKTASRQVARPRPVPAARGKEKRTLCLESLPANERGRRFQGTRFRLTRTVVPAGKGIRGATTATRHQPRSRRYRAVEPAPRQARLVQIPPVPIAAIAARPA